MLGLINSPGNIVSLGIRGYRPAMPEKLSFTENKFPGSLSTSPWCRRRSCRKQKSHYPTNTAILFRDTFDSLPLSTPGVLSQESLLDEFHTIYAAFILTALAIFCCASFPLLST